jgi:hypothetical protein
MSPELTRQIMYFFIFALFCVAMATPGVNLIKLFSVTEAPDS